MEHLYKDLKQFGKVKVDEPMAKHTTFKIGGPAAFYVVVSDSDKLVQLLRFLDEQGIPHFYLGGGSNMLVNDTGYDGVVIKYTAKNIDIRGNRVVADAGCSTAEVARESVKANLTGFEWGVGVPGTIGGAVRGNAGAMGKEMKDDVLGVDVYMDGEIAQLSNADCRFAYRHSRFKEHPAMILRVTLELEPSESKDGMKKALAALQYRNETQPKGVASTGCIFKNVDIELNENNRARLLEQFDTGEQVIQQFLRVGKISAGWLVEHVGLKGTKVGQAEISPVHGNFIVNLGGATAADVQSLIEQAKQKVYDTYGYELEEEIYIV